MPLEIPFPTLPPPGFPGPPDDKSRGYDALPAYHYDDSSLTISACDPQRANDAPPWINLDETDQITLDSMYAGVVQPDVSPGNSSPQLIRFMAKANRSEYVYVVNNSNPTDPTNLWWQKIPMDIVDATRKYLEVNKKSPPSDSHDLISLPDGTIEIKAAWRPLNPSEFDSGRFHTRAVRFYEVPPGGNPAAKCYIDAKWGLIALHIIQKTPSAPYFIYATFEQADNLQTADGRFVEDVDGNLLLPTPESATTPQVCLRDPRPTAQGNPPTAAEVTSTDGSVILTEDPTTCKPAGAAVHYCDVPGSRLYYRNAGSMPPNTAPSGGQICVNRRDNPIPDYAIEANKLAHAAIKDYLASVGVPSSPWLAYKLVNVQYYPFDKPTDPTIPNGSLYSAAPPFTAANPAPSSFYQANIVVETNRALQLFSGGLSPNINSDWNQDGTSHTNTIYGGRVYNMGGCLGCHGS